MTPALRLAAAVAVVGGFVGLLWVDRSVAAFFHERTRDAHPARWLTTLLRLPGDYTFALVCALVVWLLNRGRFRETALLILSGLPGAINGAIKGIAGRARPYTMDGRWDLFRGGWHGFWHQKNVSFMSGDATQAFAWAEAMAIVFPSGRWFFYAWALVTASQRVVMTAHWASDAFAGAVLGVVTVRLVFRILWPVTDQATESAGAVEELEQPERSSTQ